MSNSPSATVTATTNATATATVSATTTTVDLSDTTCGICWEVMTADTETRILTCSHEFHRKCIFPWARNPLGRARLCSSPNQGCGAFGQYCASTDCRLCTDPWAGLFGFGGGVKCPMCKSCGPLNT